MVYHSATVIEKNESSFHEKQIQRNEDLKFKINTAKKFVDFINKDSNNIYLWYFYTLTYLITMLKILKGT